MADTIRDKAELLALVQVGVAGGIDAQAMRDMLVSVFGVYGSIVVQGGSTAQAFASGVAEVMTEWTGNGTTNDGMTPDYANNKITIDNDGVYKVDFFCSFQGNNPIVNEFELRIDGAATDIGFQRKTSSADVGSGSFSAVVTLGATEELSVWFTGNGVSNFTAVDAALVVTRIG
ncbi:MAG: hypothetical protein DRI65_12900 [Chloroflexota bacterium]|nr:MAG: hypothetical protein DRI65_12900 [Chloroflexota bacterium]